MPTHDTTHSAQDDPGNIAGVSHGFAPDAAPDRVETLPLSALMRDTAEHIEAAVRSEIDLLQARGALAGTGIKWASIWGLVAASCLTVALLALAIGFILYLAQHIGPLLGTLVVVSALLVASAIAAIFARTRMRDVVTAMKLHPPSHSSEPVEP